MVSKWRHSVRVVDTSRQVATIALMAKVTIVPAREAKNRFGELLDSVQRQPVIITKKGRPVARMIAFVDPKRFEEVEDQIWGEKVLKAEKTGRYLSVKESEAFLKKMMARATKHAQSSSR